MRALVLSGTNNFFTCECDDGVIRQCSIKGKVIKTDKGQVVPTVCPNCGSKVKVFFKGEPVYLCSNEKCKKFFGVVPCNK